MAVPMRGATTTAAGIAAHSAAALRAFTPTSDGYRNLIMVLMIFSLSRIHQHFPQLARFRPALTLTALAGLYALMNPRFLSADNVVRTRSAKVMLGMGVMACLSTPFGISMGNSGTYIIQEYSKVLILAFLVLLGVRHSRDLYKFLWAFVLSSAFLSWLALFVFKMKRQGSDIVRIQNAYSYDSNDLGFVAVIGFVFTMLIFTVTNKRGKLICLAIMGSLGATVARTGSRGAFLTFAFVGFLLLVLDRSMSAAKKLALVGLASIGIVIAAPSGYWGQMLTILTPTTDYNWTSSTGRKEVAARGLGYMMDHPVTGLGIDNFGRAEGLIGSRAESREWDPTEAGIKWSAAHNSWIQAGAELGLPGLVLFANLVLGTAWYCRGLRKRIPEGWANGDPEQRLLFWTGAYLPVAFVGFAVGSSLVSFAWSDLIYLMVALVGGLETSLNVRLRQDAAGAGADGSGQPGLVPVARRWWRGGLPPPGIPTPTGIPLPRR